MSRVLQVRTTHLGQYGAYGLSVADLLRGSITLETAYGPKIPIPIQGSSDSRLTPAMLRVMQALKPKLTIPVAYDPNPVVLAPWGDPGPTAWPWVEAGLIGVGAVLGGLVTYTIVSLVLPKKKAA